MIKSCQLELACHLHPRHDGACQDRKGKLIPPAEPVEIITVTSRDANGKPDGFGEYHV